MAYIRQLPSGRWRAEVEKQGVRQSDTFDSKTAARNWAKAREVELEEAKHGRYPRKTLAEAMNDYADKVSPLKRGERHERLRLAAFLREFPDIGDTVISEVKTQDIARWRDARLQVVSSGSVLRDINLIRNVFTVARDEWKWCGESPFKGLRMPVENEARDRRILPGEVKTICRWLGYHTGDVKTKYQEVALAFLIGLRTGMRAGEILSLTDARVDLQRRVVTVPHKTMHLTRRPRQIPLTSAGVRLLSTLRGRGRYFTVSSESLDTIFRKARDAAGIEGVHFHDSRGEALTRLSKRVDVKTLQRISGHKDVNVLLRHYYRESSEDIAARL